MFYFLSYLKHGRFQIKGPICGRSGATWAPVVEWKRGGGSRLEGAAGPRRRGGCQAGPEAGASALLLAVSCLQPSVMGAPQPRGSGSGFEEREGEEEEKEQGKEEKERKKKRKRGCEIGRV